MGPSSPGANRRLARAGAQAAPKEPERVEEVDTLLVTFGFHCNFACTFCMVEDVLGVYGGADLATFRRYVDERPDVLSRVRRITLSGGEATLERDLADYVRFARSIPGIEHVRLQTNASRLGEGDLLARLIDAGVDEYFVSLHAADAATCDALTRVEGSFEAILQGIDAIVAAGATLITNTCMVEANHRQLAELVALVAPRRPAAMEFWNLWPRVKHDADRALLVDVARLGPELARALDACVAQGIRPTVKWFPRCLMGPHARFHDDSQPLVLVEQTYWDSAPEFACLYRAVCEEGVRGACNGLTHAYVHRYGWEEELLRPLRVAPTRAAQPRRADAASSPARPAPAYGALGIVVGLELGGWTVRALDALPQGMRVQLQRGNARLTARLEPRDDARPCYLRTRGLNLSYERVPKDVEAAVEAPLRALARWIEARE